MGTFEPLNGMSISGSGEASLCTDYAVSFSRGIRQIRHISASLRVAGVVSPVQAWAKRLNVTCVVVWGRKQNSQRALQYATRKNIPVLYVEDGWIRSCSANPHSRVSYSLLVDKLGVYYDATTPSSLEQFLNMPDDEFSAVCGSEQLQYASTCRQRMIDANITKYNYCEVPDPLSFQAEDKPLVLVIDQTMNDASVKFGGMDADRFNNMLDKAIDENPYARVVLRTHPDVVAGQRKGYLQARAQSLGVEISAAGDNPVPWLKQAETVYVGTSQLGYEALLCGCTVKVSGKPFYAGWGLTEDTQAIERRIRRRSLDQIYYATHVHHARYCCPVTGRSWTLAECLEHVELQLNYFQRNAVNHVCIGITPWKRRYLAQFLRSPYGRVRFSKRNDASHDECAVFWSFTDSPQASDLIGKIKTMTADSDASSVSPEATRVEDGFIRSSGLGSDFTAPASLVFDQLGLYFDAGSPSTLEYLLNTYECTTQERERAQALITRVVATNLTKYNVDSVDRSNVSNDTALIDRKKILVVGQVEGDQSVLRGGVGISNNTELLTEVRSSNPEAYITYKPHPDVVSGNRKGAVNTDTTDNLVDCVELQGRFLDCLDDCDELHTLTSLSGFEAILRNKAVVTYGLPFYAGWGLTIDRCKCERRLTTRSIEELAFICLVAYPHYLDLSSGEFVSVEQLIDGFENIKDEKNYIREIRWLRKLDNIISALRYQA